MPEQPGAKKTAGEPGQKRMPLKKLPPPPYAGAVTGGASPGWRGGSGRGAMLRLSGCAPLFSKLRDPRLPMLDDRPPDELPARASAIAGARRVSR